MYLLANVTRPSSKTSMVSNAQPLKYGLSIEVNNSTPRTARTKLSYIRYGSCEESNLDNCLGYLKEMSAELVIYQAK